MRILTLNYEHPPLGGGGGVAAANLCQELARQGHQIDYVTSHFLGLEREEVEGGVQLYRERVWGRQDLHTASMISMFSYPLTAIPRALRLARKKSYDIIHTHFAIPTGPAGSIVSKWSGLPNLLSVYGGDIYDPTKSVSPHAHPVLGRVVKSVLDQAELVVADSQDVARRTLDYGSKTEVEVVPPGFVLPRFEPSSRTDLGLREEPLYAISVSRLVSRKAHGDLLKAFKMADVPRLELLIVGEGPEGPDLLRLSEDLEIADRVHFLGRLDDERKFQMLDEADFFALASLHEGFGIVYQEAMHAGLPVVTTNSGGQVDFLSHGENALLSGPRDPGAMAENLRTIAGDSVLRETMGRKNRTAIKAQRIEATANRHLEYFERVIEGWRSARGRHDR